MKKVLYLICLTALATACSRFSDEITLEDLLRANNQTVKSEEIAAAPSRPVTRKEIQPTVYNETPAAPVVLQATEINKSEAVIETPVALNGEETVVYTQPMPAPLPQAVSFTDFSNVDISPEVYSIAASRATTKMIDETDDLYFNKPQKPKLYISDVRKLNDKMPNGVYFARKVTNDIIEGSRNFVVVDAPEDADYQLELLINAIPTQYPNMPILDYQLHLYNKDGVEINKWNATIKQLLNDDQSWW